MKRLIELEKRISDILRQEWYKCQWDIFWSKWNKVIWLSDHNFCSSWFMRFSNFSLSEVKDFIKLHNIPRIIDEDNYWWIIQSIRSLADIYKEYKITLAEKNTFENHSTDDRISAVHRILRCIKEWKHTVDEYIDIIWT